MPWITVDCHLSDHPKMAALSSDAARWGWIIVLTRAKLQRKPGQFASEKHFGTVLGRYSRFLKEYLAEVLLEAGEDGSLTVHDWQRHQWAVRQERHRESDGSVTPPLPEGDSRARSAVPVDVSVNSSSGELGVQGEEGPDAVVAYQRLTGRFPAGRAKEWVDRLATDYGERTVEKALADEMIADSDVHTLLSRTQDRLAAEAHEAQKQRRAQRSVQAIQDEQWIVDSMSDEQRAANMARLRSALVGKGLVPPDGKRGERLTDKEARRP